MALAHQRSECGFGRSGGESVTHQSRCLVWWVRYGAPVNFRIGRRGSVDRVWQSTVKMLHRSR